ncbi:MAG: heparinase II/III family protein [Chloroflexi bacterium]|nr:heparinase II/III family protein [Chloroflexota bacterium]
MKSLPTGLLGVFLLTTLPPAWPAPSEGQRHPVPQEHPRLLGSREELRALARQRPAEYQRMTAVAREGKADDYSGIISMALVAAIEGDGDLARKVQQMAMKYVNGPIRSGHVLFATDLALCGLAYDLCYEAWSEADRGKFHDYLNRTVDANRQSEPHVFHNGWFGYKNWGIGLACYASYHENARSPAILRALEEEFRTRAAPALELAGDGGGWAEGYYIHYWLYEWLFFCEVARRCGGVDFYPMAPKFFQHRAVASMFEAYPGLREYGSRRCVPMGDGGGRTFGGDRDKALSARRILVNYFRDDPSHQAVHTFNETTPRSSVGNYAYKDFLWHDSTVPRGSLKDFRLSHFSPGPGYVYARSSWEEDATHFFFKCGDRFTAHQHLDVGHFVICKHEELAGDGGHYDEFGTPHDVNYHLRSIAHSTVLVLDPDERWPGIRAGQVTGNDGGQHHAWPHHNGAVSDAAEWQRQKPLYDIADVLAFEDRGEYLYVAGDATRAYSPRKLERFTRQIIYLRPNTFVIFDQVKSRRPDFKKTWLLQAMRKPEQSGNRLLITNGKGRLFVQALLPPQPEVRLVSGDDLYRYGGTAYPPRRNTGPAPECRIEVSPSRPGAQDFFLHVLTVADAETASVPAAEVHLQEQRVQVALGAARIEFHVDAVGGDITHNGRRQRLANSVQLGAGLSD